MATYFSFILLFTFMRLLRSLEQLLLWRPIFLIFTLKNEDICFHFPEQTTKFQHQEKFVCASRQQKLMLIIFVSMIFLLLTLLFKGMHLIRSQCIATLYRNAFNVQCRTFRPREHLLSFHMFKNFVMFM